MRNILFHLLLLVAIWSISHTSSIEFFWQVYPIIWFVLLINQQMTFITFLFVSCFIGFIADFEIMPILSSNYQGLFWGFSSLFLIVIGSIQRLFSTSIISNIIYIGLAHEFYKLIIHFSYAESSFNISTYILEIVFNLIFIFSISTLVFFIQEKFNFKKNFI